MKLYTAVEKLIYSTFKLGYNERIKKKTFVQVFTFNVNCLSYDVT